MAATVDGALQRRATDASACSGHVRTGERARGAPGVLLTGATGFLGMALLERHLRCSDRPLHVLVRAAGDEEAQARVEHALARVCGARHPHAGRVRAVRGDLTLPALGIGERGVARLCEEVGEIVHGAATVSFGEPLQRARQINVAGTSRMLDLAERCAAAGGLRRFTYISTAYVAGEHAGCFSEDDLDVGQRFRNSYEQSKFEAETVVRERHGLPVTIVRPSIVVGDSRSGWTSSFNVLYWPLRAFARGAYVAVPGRASAPVDVVPVDYVAAATMALSGAPEALGGTFHLTAGHHASSVGELVRLASEYFDRPPPRLIEPSVYRRAVHPLLLRTSGERRARALRRSEVFFPYFDARVRYDDRRARALLHGSGIRPVPLRDYFERLVEFAVAADWGRRPLASAARPGRVRGAARARSRPGARSGAARTPRYEVVMAR
jgi:thioester reductase-like protein